MKAGTTAKINAHFNRAEQKKLKERKLGEENRATHLIDCCSACFGCLSAVVVFENVRVNFNYCFLAAQRHFLLHVL